MKLPLPKETTDYFGTDQHRLLRMSNLGLLFNKYVFSWQKDWEMKEEETKEFRNAVSKITCAKGYFADIIPKILERQRVIAESLQASGWHAESFTAKTVSRLIIGLGGASVIETGITLHPLYGFPYLPGSGLKGLARAYAEIVADASKEDIQKVFGSEDKNPHNVVNNRQGKVFFMDGIPTQFPELELDIINPHYVDYYSKKTDSKGNPIPPADYLEPRPVTFLAVASGQTFTFAVYSRYEDLADKAKEWLIGGLTKLGAGGKTNVGYGYFKENTATDSRAGQAVTSPQATSVKDSSLASRLTLIKNPQTFIEFIQNIKDNNIEELKTISFKDMKSVINLGLVDALESAKTSPEIKRIIAQKILEITKPQKKWDEKKKEKYKKLKAMANFE